MGPSWTGMVFLAWSQIWQVTLLVLAVAMLTRLVARNRPHLAYALWLVVLVKCVTPPVFASTSGVFCWLQPATHVAIVESAVAPEPVQSAAPSEELIIPLYPVESVPTLTAISMPTVKAPRARFTWSDWAAGGLVVWAVGASISLGLSIWRWRGCLCRARRVPCEPDLELAERVSGLARRLRLRRRVGVLVTQGRFGPAVTGLFRPTLLMPEGLLAEKTPDELEPLLAHELIHIRRGDLWTGLLQTIVLALWWFHPLVRWAVRQSMAEAERCCDEAVLAELQCKPRQYAGSLLSVLQYKTEWAPASAFPGAGRMGGTSKRLERIMRLRQGCRRRSPWWCWVVMVGTAAVVLPGGAFAVSGEEKEDDADDASSVQAHQEPASKAEPSKETVPLEKPTLQDQASQKTNPPFQLTPAEQTQVDSVLQEWVKASQKHERVLIEFYRFEYKPALSSPTDPANTPIHIDKGRMGFTSSGKWLCSTHGEWVDQRIVEGRRAEKMLFDGDSIYEFNYPSKTVLQHSLANNQFGLANMVQEIMFHNCRPLLFPSDISDLKDRFFLRLIELPKKGQICIDAWPRFLKDASRCQNVRMIIDTSRMEPLGLKVTLPNGVDRYAYQFTKVEVDSEIPVDPSHDPFIAEIPIAWTVHSVRLSDTQSPEQWSWVRLICAVIGVNAEQE